MKKILVFGMTENPGGVESFLLNYYRHIDREKIQMDFLCNSYEKVSNEDELISLGGHTIHFPARSRNPIKFKRELNKFFAEHADEYSAIWVNVCSLANIDYLKLAKKYGIKIRIIHSHNSQNMDSGLVGNLRKFLHKMNKSKLEKYATDFWACSPDAAKWFFNSNIIDKAVVINNAIDVKKMAFDEHARDEIRKRYNLEDKFVIGNVGRLHFQKNQSFVISVFNEYLSYDSDARLVLIGQGEDEAMLKNKVAELGISDKVMFMGVQYDIPAWLSAMDIFLFPSVFEGLGIVGIEAQANGIPVLASADVIPETVKLSEDFYFYSLKLAPADWAKKIYDISQNPKHLSYEDVVDNIRSHGYDIDEEVGKLERLLLG